MATNIVGATGIDKVQDGIIVNADIDTVAASKLTGALPAISGASLTNLPADATKLPLAGGTLTGALTINSTGNTPMVVKSTYSTGGYAELQLGASGATIGYLGSAEALVSGGAAADLSVRSQSNLVFSTSGNSERMRIDSSGNVGIGETSPATPLHITGSGSLGSGIRLEHTNDNGYAEIYTSAQSALVLDADPGNTDNGTPIVFKVDGSESMRIISNGQLLIGATTTSGMSNGTSNYGFSLSGGGQITSATNNDTNAIFNMSNGSSEHHLLFRSNGSTTGYVSTNGSSVAYNTGSDYRLKENVDYTWDATTRLKQLKPARFNFISDDTNTLVDGFIAHEVSSVVPEAITGEKDAMTTDENGDAVIDPQGIDQSKLVPLLVKTIQELEARLTAGGL